MSRWAGHFEVLADDDAACFGLQRNTVEGGLRAFVLLTILGGLLAACGQRGPLTLPAGEVDVAPSGESEVLATAEDERSDEERESGTDDK